MKNLKELVAGDKVWCGGDSSFCHDDIENIVDIKVKYDKNTGEPYNVIILSENRKFDTRNGWALNPPLAYYIKSIK